MTTIALSPTPKAQEWPFSDSATFDDFLAFPPSVPTSETLSSPDPEIYVGVNRSIEIYIHANRVFVNEVRRIGGQELHAMEWFYPTLQAIAALPWRTDNWSSGATRTQAAAIAYMLETLLKVLDSQTPPPAVVPTWNGGVQVEWHRNGIDLEIEVAPEGGIEYFFKSPAEECEGLISDDLSQLSEYARTVIES